MNVEVKQRYKYHFQITSILANHVGPDTITVVHDTLPSMADVIPLFEDMPEVPETTYLITTVYEAA